MYFDHDYLILAHKDNSGIVFFFFLILTDFYFFFSGIYLTFTHTPEMENITVKMKLVLNVHDSQRL